MDRKEFLSVIEQYLALQMELMQVFENSHPKSSDWEFLLDFPRNGQLEIRGRKWTFLKHGVGVRFMEPELGIVVDIHNQVSNPERFDKWRLERFLESQQIEISHSRLDELLTSLVQSGKLNKSGDLSEYYQLVK